MVSGKLTVQMDIDNLVFQKDKAEPFFRITSIDYYSDVKIGNLVKLISSVMHLLCLETSQ